MDKPIKAEVWADDISPGPRLAHFWTVPNVGDIIACELCEGTWKVTQVMHLFVSNKPKHGFPTEEPEAHLRISAKPWKSSS